MSTDYKETIKILDPRSEIDELWGELLPAIEQVLKSGQFIMGPNVRALEEELAKYLRVKHAITVNSGTDALVIGLRAAGIGPGDEVITSPFTFFATVEAIHHVGATPVFADIDALTFNLDPQRVAQVLTPKTKAILAVHLYGLPCAMDELRRLAEEHGLLMIEDCAQAFGATYRGVKVGTLGHVGCFSFFPSKNLGAYGDAGLICTSEDEIAEVARMLRVHGSKEKYRNQMIGYNSRMDEIQAAVLRIKLPHLDAWNEARRRVASRYDEAFSGMHSVTIPHVPEGRIHVYHQYTLRIARGIRDVVQRRLAEYGVETKVYYPLPIHRLPVYRNHDLSLPVAERAAEEVLSLPIWPGLDLQRQDTVIQRVREVLEWATSSLV
jgi:dTDP-4-amino-4,6-dideoxygalactose transaminase